MMRRRTRTYPARPVQVAQPQQAGKIARRLTKAQQDLLTLWGEYPEAKIVFSRVTGKWRFSVAGFGRQWMATRRRMAISWPLGALVAAGLVAVRPDVIRFEYSLVDAPKVTGNITSELPNPLPNALPGVLPDGLPNEQQSGS